MRGFLFNSSYASLEVGRREWNVKIPEAGGGSWNLLMEIQTTMAISGSGDDGSDTIEHQDDGPFHALESPNYVHRVYLVSDLAPTRGGPKAGQTQGKGARARGEERRESRREGGGGTLRRLPRLFVRPLDDEPFLCWINNSY